MPRSLAVLAVTAVVLLAGGCVYAESPEPYRPPSLANPEGTATGAVLFARECAWCHGAEGEGTGRAPNLNGELDGGAYTHFMLSSGRMPLPSPDAAARRGPPAFDEEQIDRLVSFVEGLGGTGPPVPRPDAAAGDTSDGADRYLTNCAACHSSTGVGGALTSGRVAPDLTNPEITAVQIAEAMLVGPGCANTNPTCGIGSGAMPRFDFTDEEVNAITAYVGFLQGSRDEGGWAMGRIGPINEGAIAWLVGLVAMLGVARWIGTRIGEEE